jgi:hypothetical protein
MAMVSCLRLYAHALVLFGWAIGAAVLDLTGTTLVVVLMCGTVAVASAVAERERSRRRRDRSVP